MSPMLNINAFKLPPASCHVSIHENKKRKCTPPCEYTHKGSITIAVIAQIRSNIFTCTMAPDPLADEHLSLVHDHHTETNLHGLSCCYCDCHLVVCVCVCLCVMRAFVGQGTLSPVGQSQIDYGSAQKCVERAKNLHPCPLFMCFTKPSLRILLGSAPETCAQLKEKNSVVLSESGGIPYPTFSIKQRYTRSNGDPP